MTKGLMIVVMGGLALAGCTMETTGGDAATSASAAGGSSQIWLGPDGCTYRMSIAADGSRTGMELVSRGSRGPCVGA
ncbi:MAG: hypothetical protein ACU0CO_18790 [Shimia sp.]